MFKKILYIIFNVTFCSIEYLKKIENISNETVYFYVETGTEIRIRSLGGDLVEMSDDEKNHIMINLRYDRNNLRIYQELGTTVVVREMFARISPDIVQKYCFILDCKTSTEDMLEYTRVSLPGQPDLYVPEFYNPSTASWV